MPVAGREGPAQPTAEVYPGAPLRAVAIEVYFPALLDAHARFGTFQREHAAEFDQLVFRRIDGDFDPEMDHPRVAVLLNQKMDRAIAIAADHLSVVTYTYAGGFAGFSSWGLPILRSAMKALEARALTRVCFQYENLISLGATNGVALEPAFRIHLPRPGEAAAELNDLRMHWKHPWPNGHVDVSLDGYSDTTPSPQAGQVSLTITGEHAGPFEVAGMDEAVAEAHRRARLTFEELITDEYRQALRKGRIEKSP